MQNQPLSESMQGVKKMNSLKKKYFNLIEIAMALGIIGFGVSSVMSIFPVALRYSNNAVTDSYCADFADQFLHYIAYEATKQDGANWTSLIGGLGTTIPQPHDGDTDITNDYDDSVGGTNVMGNIWDSTGGDGAVYTIIQEVTVDTDAPTSEVEAAIRIWKSAVKVTNPTSQASYVTLAYDDGGSPDPNKAYAAGLNIEISWPLTKPYNRREKRQFYYNVLKP